MVGCIDGVYDIVGDTDSESNYGVHFTFSLQNNKQALPNEPQITKNLLVQRHDPRSNRIRPLPPNRIQRQKIHSNSSPSNSNVHNNPRLNSNKILHKMDRVRGGNYCTSG